MMADSMSNGNSERESFGNFFEVWLREQNQLLQQLSSASRDMEGNGHTNTNTNINPLVERVVHHYEQYYRAKSTWAQRDTLSVLSPSWLSTLEDAFLWIGGWRPTMAIHLLYSKSGLQLEARLQDVIRGLTTGDLGDLSPTQLTQVNQLQMRTVREEKEITEKMASQQETVADPVMVEMSHAATVGTGIDENHLKSTLAHKERGLEEVLHLADDLRLRTLKAVVDVLTPPQAVHFLIAAAELHLRLHDWGMRRDATTSDPATASTPASTP